MLFVGFFFFGFSVILRHMSLDFKNAEHILLVGATGFTGKRVLNAIKEHNEAARLGRLKPIRVTIFCRLDSEIPDIEIGSPITITRGDLGNVESLQRALDGKNGMIYVASLGFGHAKGVVEACEKANVKRAVFTSTTAIFTKLNAATKSARQAAEADVIGSKMDWTIIRPTMIFGRKGDRNMERLVRYVQKFPVLFVPGSASTQQQPNFVDDVAKATVQAYFSPKTKRKAYNISGRNPVSFRKVVNTTAKALNKKITIIEIPLKPVLYLLSVYEKFSKNPRLKAEQLLRLNEDKTFDHTQATLDFGYDPVDFETGIRNLVSELQVGEKK